MPILIHPELPSEQWIDVPDSSVPMHRAAGWRSASDEEIAEFREETRLIRVPLPETVEPVTEPAENNSSEEEDGSGDDDDAPRTSRSTH